MKKHRRGPFVKWIQDNIKRIRDCPSQIQPLAPSFFDCPQYNRLVALGLCNPSGGLPVPLPVPGSGPVDPLAGSNVHNRKLKESGTWFSTAAIERFPELDLAHKTLEEVTNSMATKHESEISCVEEFLSDLMTCFGPDHPLNQGFDAIINRLQSFPSMVPFATFIEEEMKDKVAKATRAEINILPDPAQSSSNSDDPDDAMDGIDDDEVGEIEVCGNETEESMDDDDGGDDGYGDDDDDCDGSEFQCSQSDSLE